MENLKRWEKTIVITTIMRSGFNIDQIKPSILLLYFTFKSLLTSSTKRSLYQIRFLLIKVIMN